MSRGGPADRLLGLLGLARRAGKLALGAGAVQDLVRKGRRPLVILARDIGPAQRQRLLRLQPVRGFLLDAVGRDDLGRALGRKELAVVALSDRGFVNGVLALGFSPAAQNADRQS